MRDLLGVPPTPAAIPLVAVKCYDLTPRRQILRPHSLPFSFPNLARSCWNTAVSRRSHALISMPQETTTLGAPLGSPPCAHLGDSQLEPLGAPPLHAGALTWLLFCGFLAGAAAECPAQNESSPSTMACDSANTACAPGDYCQNFSSAPCAFPLCRQQIVPMGGADLRKVRLPSEKPQLYTLCAV